MMNEFINAAELATLKIASLPMTPKGINDRARRDAWPKRTRAVRGGGVEYLVAGLPLDVQEAIKEQQIANMLKESKPAPLPSTAKKKNPVVRKQLKQMGLQIDDTVNGLTEKQRDIAHARMSIIVEVNKMIDIGGMALKPAAQYVIHQIN